MSCLSDFVSGIVSGFNQINPKDVDSVTFWVISHDSMKQFSDFTPMDVSSFDKIGPVVTGLIVSYLNLQKACHSINELVSKWDAKIRVTVRNNSKIQEHEIDDVVQNIYIQAIEKEWLSQYTGGTAFSTFIYTYVHTSVQNYINVRDGANRTEFGTRKFMSFSELNGSVDIPMDSFLDFLHVTNADTAGISLVDDRESSVSVDAKDFFKKSANFYIPTLFSLIRVSDVILALCFAETDEENKKKDALSEVSSALSVDRNWVVRVREAVSVAMQSGFKDAFLFLERNFHKIP